MRRRRNLFVASRVQVSQQTLQLRIANDASPLRSRHPSLLSGGHSSKGSRAAGLFPRRGVRLLPFEKTGGLRVAALRQAASERRDLPVAQLPNAPEDDAFDAGALDGRTARFAVPLIPAPMLLGPGGAPVL